MSVTIRIKGKRATIAKGTWRSIDAELQELLNSHLVQLEIPGHWPPRDRELEAVRLAVKELGGKMIDASTLEFDRLHGSDGTQLVF